MRWRAGNYGRYETATRQISACTGPGRRESKWEREDSKDGSWEGRRWGDGAVLIHDVGKAAPPRSEPALPEVVALDLDRRTPCRMQPRQTRSRRDPRFPRPANRLIVYFIIIIKITFLQVLYKSLESLLV